MFYSIATTEKHDSKLIVTFYFITMQYYICFHNLVFNLFILKRFSVM